MNRCFYLWCGPATHKLRAKVNLGYAGIQVSCLAWGRKLCSLGWRIEMVLFLFPAPKYRRIYQRGLVAKRKDTSKLMNKNESSLRSDKRDCRVSRWIDGYIRSVCSSAGRRVNVLPMTLLDNNIWIVGTVGTDGSFEEIPWVSMGFHAILCPRPSSAPEDSYCMIIKDYLSVVSRRFYASIMSIMSQSPPQLLENWHTFCRNTVIQQGGHSINS